MSFEALESADRAIAVVGVGAVLPDAPDAGAFWNNVLAARYSITEVTPERWDPAVFWDRDPKAPGKTYSKLGGWVRGFSFDSLRFRIPPRVAASMDEAQMWGVTATREALLDAGHPDRGLDLARTATVLGNAMGGELHYLTVAGVTTPPLLATALEHSAAFQRLDAQSRNALRQELLTWVRDNLPGITEDSMPGELANVVAGRIAHVFDLHGPNYVVDAACASSLAALDSAIEGLLSGHFDVALTGGVDRNMGPGTFAKFSKIGALSPDGSRPFDRGANGFIMGEGAAVFVLKRLADAERAGDKIYAVVRSVGGSSDGRGKGITAPNPEGQKMAMRRAYERGAIHPSTIGLLEAHGTSTPVGDAAEVGALLEMFGPYNLPKRSVALGSVKSQIGHLKAAAGAAGLLKAVLALHHKVLPPSAQFRDPNPEVPWDTSPLFVNTQSRPWERPAAGIRRAAVSSFGFGGTNFHVLLEEHVPGMLTSRRPQVQVPGTIGSQAGGSSMGQSGNAGGSPEPKLLRGMVMVHGADLAQLRAELVKLAEQVEAGAMPPMELPTAVSMHAPERIAIDYGNQKELLTRVRKAIEVCDDDRPAAWRLLRGQSVFRGKEAPGTVAFLFPGQGSQYVNMLRELRDASETVRRVFDEADEVMKERLDGKKLTELIYVKNPDPKQLEEAEAALRQTTVTQPAMLAADIALARLLGDYGISPDVVMGHSLGEYAALVVAGVMPFEDALIAVSARAKEMASVSLADPGKMASVIGPYEKIEPVLKQVKGYVVPANMNSRMQTVIAGASEAIDQASEALRDAGLRVIQLSVSHAFHSEIVAPASEPLRAVLRRLRLSAPSIPVIGNVDADLYPSGPDAIEGIIDRLGRQIASPVQFVQGLERLYANGARVFVEVGPKKVLASFAEEAFQDRSDFVSLPTNNLKKGPEASFGAALAYLYSVGRGRARRERTAGPVPEVSGAQTPPAAAPTPQAPPARSAPMQQVHGSPKHAAPRPAEPKPLPQAAPPAAAAPGADSYVQLGKLFAEFLDKGMQIYKGAPAAAPQDASLPASASLPARQGSVVISGAGIGLPGESKSLFDENNFDRILAGDQFIEAIPAELRQRMVDKNVVRLVKRDDGSPSLDRISSDKDVLKLAGRRGSFDLVSEFGVARERAEAFDVTTAMAIGAGIDALRDAGIPLVRRYKRTSKGTYLPDRWMLPEPLADETGVIFASAFPGYNRFAELTGAYFKHKQSSSHLAELEGLRAKLGDGAAAVELDKMIARERDSLTQLNYMFERKFLFEVLSMGHAQFAEMIGARGPNTAVNSACASTTLAVAMAEDWIRRGRCTRVVVIGADDVTSDQMLEWIGAGFLATGAATIEDQVSRAALPFDRRRHGMILGMGACAMVVESEDAMSQRGMRGIAEVLEAEFVNSAFHGTRLDVDHIRGVMRRFIDRAEVHHGIDRREIAPKTVFISHETYTPARGGSAAAEVMGLREAFGEAASQIVVANIKGFTGHPMGVGLEDAMAVKILERQIVPPIPNFKEVDPELGELNLSKGGHYPVQYALRFAAGFGSQLAIALMRRICGPEERVAEAPRYQAWLQEVSGYPQASTEIVKHTLRVRDQGLPQNAPVYSGWKLGDVPVARTRYPGQADEPAAAAVHRDSAFAPLPLNSLIPPPTSTVPPPVAASGGDPTVARILEVFSSKTGYPVEMLALDLDLEADLGIDTVKQAEIFAELRTVFDLPRRDDMKLRDYPTLQHVIGYVREGRPDLVALSAPIPPPPATPSASAAAPPAAGQDAVTHRVLQIVADKTGYPIDMLALDLDLEADLGIDTVKQAEVFAELRAAFELPRRDDMKLRDYPTLQHVIGYVRQGRPDLAAAEPVAAAAAVASPAAAPGAADNDPVTGRVLQIVADKTGYPIDMLALDLDLEADLGVDTVKQAEVFAELRSVFELPRRDDMKLRDYPTLGHVIQFVRAGRPDLAQPVVQPQAPVQAPAPSAAPANAEAGHDAITRAVIEIVADKTGYPPDMLALDLDLEADLGVDTVKQAEVFAVVRDRFNIPRVAELKLRDYPTLAHVVQFVRSQAPGQLAEAAAEPAKAPVVTAMKARRLVPTPMVRAPLAMCKPTGCTLGSSRVVIVPDHAGAAGILVEALEAQGATVLVADAPTAQELVAMVEAWAAQAPVTGIYFLRGLDQEQAFDQMEPEQLRELLAKGVRSLYALSRSQLDALGRKGAFLVTATRMGGTLGYGPNPSVAPVAGALSGFTKALARERPEALVKVVDFEPAAAPDAIARTLMAETEADPAVVEVGYAGGLRLGITLLSTSAPVQQGGLTLDQATVFVVSGAGGAITSAITADLAAHSKGTFHLLDLAPAPDASNPDLARFKTDREGLKKELLERMRKTAERVTPAMVEKELARTERDVASLDAIEAVERAGGKAFYHSCDVTDPEAVARIVEQIRAAHGRLDVLVHAAGLERSRPLEVKEPAEFDLIFNVKALGLFNLLRATRGMELRALVSFSSVAGRFGNAGQVDYSAANDLLCKVTSAMRWLRPDTRAVVVDWTAWGGIGMATRGSIPEIMRRAGIEMLDPAEGLPVVRRELMHGTRGELVVAGALGILTQPRDEDGGVDPALRGKPQVSEGTLPLCLVRSDPYEGVVLETVLDPQEPFLNDHRIDGVPVLPGVMGVEIFARAAALLAPGLQPVAIHDVRFEAPLKCYRDERRTASVTLRLLLRESGMEANCVLSSVPNVKGAAVAPEPKRHFSATLVLAPAPTHAPASEARSTGPAAAKVNREALYRAYFHDESFRVLEQTSVAADGHGLIGKLAQPLPSLFKASAEKALTAPRLLELCFQTAGVMEIGSTRKLGLPSSIEEIRIHQGADDSAIRFAEVDVSSAGEGMRFDAIVRDDKGSVLMEMRGYRTSALPSTMPDDIWAPLGAGISGLRS